MKKEGRLYQVPFERSAKTEMISIKSQNNYQAVFEQALNSLRQRDSETITALGATEIHSGLYTLPVLESKLEIDLNDGSVHVDSTPQQPRMEWRILALHYLLGAPPFPALGGWMSFADFSEGRGYDSVYRARVLNYLCATAGRNHREFTAACRRLGAQHEPLGDEGFRFRIFPHVEIIIVRYGGDEEFTPGVSFLYPANILSYFEIEDVVVLSERLVGRLQRNWW